MIEITKEQIEAWPDITKEDIESWRRHFKNYFSTPELEKICDLAIRGLEIQPEPIDQAQKDGTDILAFGGRRGSQMSGHEYEVDHEGPTLVSWESGHWWEPGEMCNYVKPTKFIRIFPRFRYILRIV